MAHTKSQGKTRQKSNRPGQRRGDKVWKSFVGGWKEREGKKSRGRDLF